MARARLLLFILTLISCACFFITLSTFVFLCFSHCSDFIILYICELNLHLLKCCAPALPLGSFSAIAKLWRKVLHLYSAHPSPPNPRQNPTLSGFARGQYFRFLTFIFLLSPSLWEGVGGRVNIYL